MNYFLNERMEEIREFINITSPRKKEALLQNNAMWDMLCSCMDMIEDLEYALESYLAENPENAETGRKYLLIFGALQALYVQQDAVKNLHKSLNIPYTLDPSIEEIRDIRNDAAGHPTNRRNKEFIFINRSFLGVHEFRFMKLNPTEEAESFNSKDIDINVPDLIATQRNIFGEVLNNVIEVLKKEEMEHRKKFTDKKLAGVFSGTTYPFEKIFDAVLSTNSSRARRVNYHVNQILECVEKFKNGLRKRGEPDDNITDTYENLEYVLQHIKAYFDKDNKTHIQKKDAYIFTCFARQQVDALEDTASEIDERYSVENNSKVNPDHSPLKHSNQPNKVKNDKNSGPTKTSTKTSQ